MSPVTPAQHATPNPSFNPISDILDESKENGSDAMINIILIVSGNICYNVQTME